MKEIIDENFRYKLEEYKSSNVVDFLKEYALKKKNEINFIKSSTIELINSFEANVTKLPSELKEVYMFSNGFFSPSLDILPIFDKNNSKKTWNSVNKANSENTNFIFKTGVLSRFCVFGVVRSNVVQSLLFERNELRFYYQDMEGDIKEADVNLRDLILVCLYGDYMCW